VNSRGMFNVPFGKHTNPGIFNEAWLRGLPATCKGRASRPRTSGFSRWKPRRTTSFTFDPPYHPRSKTSYFTAYTRDAFGEEDQRKLAEVYRALDKKGCLLMLSNSDTPLIRELDFKKVEVYKDFHIREVSARRNINSKRGSARFDLRAWWC
jgi:DNA adenine methylase